MTQKATIIHVEFKTNGAHFYFGSISAIYSIFSAKDIGVSQNRLYHVNIEPGRHYENKKCIIRKGPLYRKRGNRANQNMLNNMRTVNTSIE